MWIFHKLSVLKINNFIFNNNSELKLVKKSNSILFIFYKNYDSRGIKIIILVCNFCLNICINQLFFTESTMHKIYTEESKYNFMDHLSQIVLSTIISSVIITIVKLIILTDKAINTFKKSFSVIQKKEAKKNAKNLMTRIKIKYIIFCILVVILTVIFWYYVACFCAVFINI